jgi:hypothetical protein
MVPGGRALRRIATALKAFCVVLTASLVVFVLLNVFAAYRYPRDTRAVLAGQPVFNDRLKSLYEAIYGLPIADVRKIVAESYTENAWIFEPYVQFREQPRRGRFVNISAEGFRLNSATGPTTVDTTGSIPVFVFGGSTTFGYGVRDEDTIAAHLEDVLRRRHPDQARPFAVYNFGRGYYGSSQEVLLLRSLLNRRIVPKIVVLIDGVNEQFCPQYSANLAEVFKILQHDPAAKLREVLASLPVTRLAGPRRTELAANALYVNRTLAGYAFECGCPQPDMCHIQLVQTYALNKQLVRTMGKEFGFEAYFVLQPVGGYRNRFLTSPDGQRRNADNGYLWGMFERFALSGEHDYSFAGILEDYPGEAFVDVLHYSSAVNRLIAERLYDKMTGSAAKTAEETPPPTDRAEAMIHVAADPATVISYFLTPSKIVRWIGRSARIDAVRGGAFEIEFADGTWRRATLQELDPPRRLSLAFQPDRANLGGRVDITFTSHQAGTVVRVTHTGLPAQAGPSVHAAWEHLLGRLSLAVVGISPPTPDAAKTAQSQK